MHRSACSAAEEITHTHTRHCSRSSLIQFQKTLCVCLLSHLLGMHEGLFDLAFRKTLSKVDDGIVQDSAAFWVVAFPRGGMVVHVVRLPGLKVPEVLSLTLAAGLQICVAMELRQLGWTQTTGGGKKIFL